MSTIKFDLVKIEKELRKQLKKNGTLQSSRGFDAEEVAHMFDDMVNNVKGCSKLNDAVSKICDLFQKIEVKGDAS